MCDMLVSDLGELGFEVKAHTAAPAALEALVASEFDAVVADLNMPGMTGLELCERIVASHPDVPVIVITAFGSIQTAIAA
ncbi:MAG: sigma-54-dependent Fis family transcriptional regulator, partial [Candidatus Rokuibacteriota bacterium]